MPTAPRRLRCEFVENPTGVTRAQPRLSWWAQDKRSAEIQTAYEILAASSPDVLDEDIGDLWASGRVSSSDTTYVAYSGQPLSSAQRVWWKVRTFDSDGLASPWSDTGSFEVGLLEAFWPAQWIGTHLMGSRSTASRVAQICKTLELASKAVYARLYVAALGDYRLFINGNALGAVVAPQVLCDFSQQVYYQTYDVTECLTRGANTLGVLLADGYYAGSLPGRGRNAYGVKPCLKVVLNVLCEDGSQLHLGSDQSWRWQPSWILGAETRFGEHVDARQKLDDWCDAGVDLDSWPPVETVSVGEVQLTAQLHPALAAIRMLPAVQELKGRRADFPHSRVFDFGTQIVGRLLLTVKGTASDAIEVEYANDVEFKHPTRDTYTSLGDNTLEAFEPHFSLHGFRYVRVSHRLSTTAISAVHAMKIGVAQLQGISFESDHPTLNQLFDALSLSVDSVSRSVPMRGIDPEQHYADFGYAVTWLPVLARDERAHALVRKWVADLAARLIDFEEPHRDVLAEFTTLIHTVWALYRFQGDRDVLDECYAVIRAHAMSFKHQGAELIDAGVRGDLYVAPTTSHRERDIERVLVATASLYGTCNICAQIAHILNASVDRQRIDATAADLKAAFRRRYLTNDGHLAVDTQSGYVASIHHELLEGDELLLAQARLATLLQAENYHASVAPALIPALLPVLTNAQRLDLAYMLLLQTSAPSWLASIDGGGALIGYPQDLGFDPAQIGIWEWLVDCLIGVRVTLPDNDNRGEARQYVIEPRPPFGQQFLAGSPVQWIDASIPTAYGMVRTAWTIKESHFELKLEIPPSCVACVITPDGIEQHVQSGTHRFVMDFNRGGDGIPTLLDLTGND